MPGKVGTGFPSGIATNKGYSNGVTGGIALAGLSGVAGDAGAGLGSGLACGAACIGSTEPAACCGAASGRLRGTGGRPGVITADFAAGFWCVAGGNPA